MSEVRFPAQVAKIQTLADGGLRFTFDAPESEAMAAAQLIEFKRWGIAGTLVFIPDEEKHSGRRRKRKEPE